MADCGKLLCSALAGNAHASLRIGCQNLLLLRLPLTSPQTQLHSDRGRGAPQVGLSLSLFVLLDRQIADARFRSLAVFFMGAQALLTLVVQGTTMPWLLQARRATADVLCCPRWLDRHPPCSSCTGLDGDCYLCGVRRWLGSRHGAA